MKEEKLIAERIGKRVYRDGDRCLKVFGDNYTKADILHEALNLARVEETGLNVPKLLEVTTVEGNWAIVSEYITGDTLAYLMEQEPDKYDEYMSLFIDLQLQVHSKTCAGLRKLRDNLTRRISDSPLLTATTKYDMISRVNAMPRHNKVCHGDFNPSNIIITADGTPYIIDWSHSTRGNSAAEAAMTYLYFLLRNEKEHAEKYFDLFCEKNITERDYLLQWLPIVAASFTAKCTDEEFELLKPWIFATK